MSARWRKQPKGNGYYIMGMPGFSDIWHLIYVQDGKYCFYKSNIDDPKFTLELKDRLAPETDRFYGPINLPEVKA